jgi:hypothetical protein
MNRNNIAWAARTTKPPLERDVPVLLRDSHRAIKSLLSQLFPNHWTRLTNKFCPKFRIAQWALQASYRVINSNMVGFPINCLQGKFRCILRYRMINYRLNTIAKLDYLRILNNRISVLMLTRFAINEPDRAGVIHAKFTL